MSQYKRFLELSEQKAFDTGQRQKVEQSLYNYRQLHGQGLVQFNNLPLARERASYARWKALESLDKYLLEFENNFIKRGGRVLWAPDTESVQRELENILKQHNTRSVVISKSTTAHEIGLPEFLLAKSIGRTETDLGEYILQQAGEKPFHPVTPAMHKSVEEIAAILRTASSEGPTPQTLAKTGCDQIRDALQGATLGISGANFLVADIGAVVITENEGNARMGASRPDVHVVIAGIEKILPSVNDLEVMLPLLATYGTGQNITAYNNLLMGPRFSDEEDGPREMIVILLDNGRSALLEKQEQRQALKCIHCGACLNVCPIFKSIGGQAYETAYNGPIGSVVAPVMNQAHELNHLSHASTLCGACTDVCPVHVPLHMNLIANRRDFVSDGQVKKSEKMLWYAWKRAVLDRKKMNRGAGMKNFFLRTVFKKSWGERRTLPEFAPRSFNELWKEKNNA